ncbi:MAG TPA: hypothetical protein VNC18_19675 [Gemmatimonadaceae bacterium]|jgi:hypothetical protein|nr:hypothetical protein [Gemmatimonadaceae bacterium]
MDDSHRSYGDRPTPPTTKQKAAVQRAVKTLLDVLAPERTTTRAPRQPVPIEQHRTPNGCVLQAPTAALSVSWFPEGPDIESIGELQVVLWRGVASRRGVAPRPEGAVVVRELNIRPVESPPDAFIWRTDDGATYDTEGLAAYCLALLKEQMLVDDPTGTAQATTPRRRD